MAVQVWVESTPNPNSIKVSVNQTIAQKPTTYQSAAEAGGDPLATKLFAIPGVTMIFEMQNFISVMKEPGADWNTVAERAKQIVREHFNLP